MSSFLWRIIIAVICVVLIWNIIPPFFRIVGFDSGADILLILRICISGIAVLYVLKNNPIPS